jgi:uncharacterized protein (DUF952 family)
LIHLRPGRDAEPADIAPGPEGFVHLCAPDKVHEVTQRFFADGNVTRIVVETDALDADKLRFEDTYGHGEFPHYYGTIPKTAIVEVT